MLAAKNRKSSTMTEVLAIVPDRAGSKGLPGKNVSHLSGHPLKVDRAKSVDTDTLKDFERAGKLMGSVDCVRL